MRAYKKKTRKVQSPIPLVPRTQSQSSCHFSHRKPSMGDTRPAMCRQPQEPGKTDRLRSCSAPDSIIQWDEQRAIAAPVPLINPPTLGSGFLHTWTTISHDGICRGAAMSHQVTAVLTAKGRGADVTFHMPGPTGQPAASIDATTTSPPTGSQPLLTLDVEVSGALSHWKYHRIGFLNPQKRLSLPREN